MSASLDPLILDLVEWVAAAPRAYAEVMEAWRTACPRLTVWEDAMERGYLQRARGADGTPQVLVTPQGLAFLAARRPGAAAVPEGDAAHQRKLERLRRALASGALDLRAPAFTPAPDRG